MISDLYKPGWSVKEATETRGADGVVTKTWADVSGLENIGARYRQLSLQASRQEIFLLGKDQVIATGRVYTDFQSSITEKNRLVNPDGEVFNIKSTNNPHGLNEFLQIDVYRSDVESADDE